MRHWVGRKLQMNEIVRPCAMAPQRVPRHRRTDRRAAELQPRPRMDCFADDRQIGRFTAARDDVGIFDLALEPARELEDIALEAAEVVVGIPAERQDPNHAAPSASR